MSSGLAIFVLLILAVTVMGFLAARWKAGNLRDLDEWALGGRRFGTIVSWFLLGGDLYTAYTFIAVPALVFGTGALGFFAVPYATIAYPFVFIVMPRFWTIAKRRGYVTTADFVRDRYGSRSLELVIAITGVLAAMPYIALQLVGMSDAQLALPSSLDLLNDMAVQANNAYMGHTDPSGGMQMGVTQIYQDIQKLASFTVKPYK